ncbi:MAG: hypothetical protein GF418_04595 [Chitinivibrionales bacterium]|nr:hypothetical protein [Chitinivibrionales bacterium]MBD3394887.1 hypothetical protein [Chitinivibrionales bacterium]
MDIPVLAMIARSGWVARTILIVLALLSIFTWAIIFNRWYFLSRAARLSKLFQNQLGSLHSMSDLEKLDSKFENCPAAMLGGVTLGEYKRILADARSDSGVKDWSFYLQSQFEMASDRVETASAGLGARFDRGLILLAITSSVAPFLGLLGTVWGIMNSFYQIGNQGSASLPVVAPGIAEALITTIVGLGVAIPALFFYNVFMHQAGRAEDQIESVAEQLLLRLKREIFALLFRKSAQTQRQYP